VRRTVLGFWVLVHHPHGAVSGLREVSGGGVAGTRFASAAALARALARDVLRRAPDAAAVRRVEQLLAAMGERLVLAEDDLLRAAAAEAGAAPDARAARGRA
jgi:hypothetical protein